MIGKKTAISSLLAFGLLTTACAGAEDIPDTQQEANTGESVVLTFGHTLTTGSFFDQFASTFKEEIETRTDGAVTVNIFPSSQLGGEVEMIDAVRAGDQDLVMVSSPNVSLSVPQWDLFSAPYLFESAEDAAKVLDGEVGDKLQGYLGDSGLTGLPWIAPIERDIFSSKELQLPDMSGFKLRTIESPGFAASYEAFGATPTPMAYSEVYVGLEQGTIDGGETSPDQYLDDRFFEVAPHLYLSHVHFLPALAVTSPATLDKLDEEQQEAFMEAAEIAAESTKEFYLGNLDDAIEKAKESGVTVHDVDIDEMIAVSEETRNQFIATVQDGEEIYQMIQESR